MLFLLAVFISAIWLGRGPAVISAFLGVALFDFFFVPPYLSFAVADAQYLITFAVMLSVGLITSHLVSRLAERTEQAQESERQTRLLHTFGRDLGVAMNVGHVEGIVTAFLDEFDLESIMLLSRSGSPSELQPVGDRHLAALEMGFVRSAHERNTVIEADTLAEVSTVIAFLPMAVSNRVQGVLAVGPKNHKADKVRELRPLLEAVAAQTALIIEHLNQAEAIKQGELRASEERLRTSILASLSHDLRTPLTSLVGLADALTQQQSPTAVEVTETAGIIRDQAQAMHHMLSNMLEMARLKANDMRLNKEWQPIDEIIGSSLRLLAGPLSARTLDIRIQPGLPLVSFDAVLMERVVFNLLDNAIKYSAPETPIQLNVLSQSDQLVVEIINEGKGFAPASIDSVFDLFVRGDPEAASTGTGIGLAICKAIVTAHDGQITAENLLGGACVRFTLPLGTPPSFAEESEA
jgi:two-component system sensor histidine kinase KdpD